MQEEIGNKKLKKIFDQCAFMTKGAEKSRVNTIYSLKLDKKIFHICKPCIEFCQQGPEYDEDCLIEDMGEDFVCECADYDHVLKFKKGDKDEGLDSKQANESIPCQFAATLDKINSTAFFQIGDKNLCLFCYFDLTEQVQSRPKNKLKVQEAVFSDQKFCTCKGMGCDHSLGATISKMKTCFKYTVSRLEDEKFLSYFLRPQELIYLFYNFPIFSKFFDSYFKEVSIAITSKSYPVEEIEFDQKNEEFICFRDEEIIWTYINDFLIIFSNMNLLIYERQEMNLKETLLAKVIDFKKLNVLLDSKAKRNGFVFNAQIAALNIYFNTYIFPKVKQYTSVYFTNDLNLSPIHRLMFFSEDKQFVVDIGGKKKFFEMIQKIMFLITSIHEDRDVSILSKIKDIKHIILILIKYLHVFGYFTITSDSLLDLYAGIINDVSKIIYFLMNNTVTNPIGVEPNALSYIYKYLKDEKKFDREETYDKYTPTNVIRLRFERLIKVLMIKQNDLMFKKAFLDHDEKEGPFDFKSLNFTFEDDPTSRKLIGGLLDMGFQKNDGSGDDRSHMDQDNQEVYINTINDVEISQILFHEDDCYINGLKGLCQCYIVEKMPPVIMKDIMLERDNYYIPNNLSNIFQGFEADKEDYYHLRISNQEFCNQMGIKCREVITILLPLLNLEMNNENGELIQTEKTTFERNFELQFKFAKIGFLESLMRLTDVVHKVKLKHFKASLAVQGIEEDEFKGVDNEASLKMNEKITNYTQAQVILLLLKSLEILTYMNPFLSVPIFMDKFLATLSAEPHLLQKTYFLKKKLISLDVNYYHSNLLPFLKWLLNSKNQLIKTSDTTLILSLIKHILKMNNNKIFSNLTDILRDLINNLIGHFSNDDNPVIKRYTNPSEAVIVKNPISRLFGNFYHTKEKKIEATRVYSNDENLAYQENVFKAFQKIMYYVNNHNFFHQSILKHDGGSLEYFSLFTGKLHPKISLLLMRNLFHYCFRYPRRFFEKGNSCHSTFISEPLFWVDDVSEFAKEEEVSFSSDAGDDKEKTQGSTVPTEGKEFVSKSKSLVDNKSSQVEIKEKFALDPNNKTKLSSIMKNLIMAQVKVFNNFVTNNPQFVKNRESFYMRFFYNTVVYPSMIYIYKTILVTKNLSIMQKYEIYEIILNLLNSFTIFLEEITKPELFNLEKILYINDKRKFFIIEGSTKKEILIQSQKIVQILKNMENNDPIKIRDNIKFLEETFKYFRILDDKNIINIDNVFSDYVNMYDERKLNYSGNILKTLLNLNDTKAANYKENTYYMFMKNILKIKYTKGIPEDPDSAGENYNTEQKKEKHKEAEAEDKKLAENEEIIETKQSQQHSSIGIVRKEERQRTLGKSKKDLLLEQEKPLETEEDEENKLETNRVDSQSHLRFVLINMTKIILIDPDIFQSYILRDENVDLCRNLIGGYMIPKIRKFFPSQILQGFFQWDSRLTLRGPYGSLLDIIEFLRVLSEGHNQAFQVFMETIDMELTEGKSTKLNNFLFKINTDIIELLEHYLDRQELLGFMEKEPRVDYFFKLYDNISNFFIEIIQGSFSYVYLTTFIPIPDSEFYSFHKRHMLLIDNIPRCLRYSAYISSFLKLVDNILQEKVTTTDEDIKDVLVFLNERQNKIAEKEETKLEEFSKVEAFCHLFIVRSLNYFNLYQNAKFCLRKAYSKVTGEDIANIKQLNYKILLNLFKENSDFSEDILFSISTSIFIILKNLAMKNIYDKVKANSFMKNLQDNADDEFKFFSRVIRSVELNYTVPENIANLRTLKEKVIKQDPEEKILFKKVEDYRRKTNDFFAVEIFLINPLSLKLEDNDINVIISTSDVTNLHDKQVHLLDYITRILEVVNFRKEIDSWDEWSPFVKNIAILNYTEDKLITFFANWISVGFMLFINTLLCFSLNQEDYLTGGTFKSLIIFVNTLHLLINFALISNWAYIDGLYNIRMDKSEAMSSKFPVFFNFIVALISISSPQFYFLFSLGLFSMVPLIPVMNIVIIAIYNRRAQFAAAGIFLIIFVLIFGAIGFFFLRDNMQLSDASVQFCTNYFECFMNTFTFGLRELGVQDQPYILKFGESYYWTRFFYDWMFFFFTLFILINIFNGIVVDTFQSYREDDEKINDHLKNVCYICHLTRNDFEIKSLDFEYHVNNEHSVRDYIDFLIKINSMDENDLNNLGTQTLKLMEDREPSMFPMKVSMSLEKKKK